MAVLPPKKNPDPRTNWLVSPAFAHMKSGKDLPLRKRPEQPPAAPPPKPETVEQVMSRTPSLAGRAARRARSAEPEPEEFTRHTPRNRK